jgi:hypothetical protein
MERGRKHRGWRQACIVAATALTLVIEMETPTITWRSDAQGGLRAWLEQARALAPRRCEVLICTGGPRFELPAAPANVDLQVVSLPGLRYYALKNAGANLARGEVVYFVDGDCRPSDRLLERMLAVFDDQRVMAASGSSRYDGDGFRARLESALSFGYLHTPWFRFEPPRRVHSRPFGCVMAHNVAVRRSTFERDPFGPYQHRCGGEIYLTKRLLAAGQAIQARPELVIFHENAAASWKGLMDRHLRDHFHFFVPAGPLSPLRVLASAMASPLLRLPRLLEAGPYLGIRSWPQRLAGMLILLWYMVLDTAVVSSILLRPTALRRWLYEQFGPELPSARP